MILVKVLGERTDVAAYLSYYAKEELKTALGVKDNEVVFEVVVSDYFVDGDLKGFDGILINVFMDQEHGNKKKEIAEILNTYCNYFESLTWITFHEVDSKNSFVFENDGVKKFEDGEECECEDHKCHCHEHHDHECGCGCHDEDCECHSHK